MLKKRHGDVTKMKGNDILCIVEDGKHFVMWWILKTEPTVIWFYDPMFKKENLNMKYILEYLPFVQEHYGIDEATNAEFTVKMAHNR